MASEGKKIVFEGVDNGVSSMFEKIKQKETDLFSSILKNIQNFNLSSQDQVKTLDNIVKAIEKENKALFENKKLLLDVQYQKDLLNKDNDSVDRKVITRQYKKDSLHLAEEKNESKLLISDIKQKAENFKYESQFEEKGSELKINNRLINQTKLQETDDEDSKINILNKEAEDIVEKENKLLFEESKDKDDEKIVDDNKVNKFLINKNKEKDISEGIDEDKNKLTNFRDTIAKAIVNENDIDKELKTQSIKEKFDNYFDTINNISEESVESFLKYLKSLRFQVDSKNQPLFGELKVDDIKQNIKQDVDKLSVENIKSITESIEKKQIIETKSITSNETENVIQNIVKKTSDELEKPKDETQNIIQKTISNEEELEDKTQKVNRIVSELDDPNDTIQNVKRSVDNLDEPSDTVQKVERKVIDEKNQPEDVIQNITRKITNDLAQPEDDVQNITQKIERKVNDLKKPENETQLVKRTIDEEIKSQPKKIVSSLLDNIKEVDENVYNKTIKGALSYSNDASVQESFIESNIGKMEMENKRFINKKQEIGKQYTGEVVGVYDELDKGIIQEDQVQDRIEKLKDISNEKIKNIDDSISTNEKLIALFRELIDAVKITSKEEIYEDKKNVIEQVKEFDKDGEKLDDSEKLIRSREKKDLKSEGIDTSKKEPSIFKESLKALLAVEGIKSILDFGKETALNLSKTEEGESLFAETVAQVNPLGIPIGAFFGGGLARRNKEQFAVEQAESRLGGLTGKTDDGFSNIKTVDEQVRFGGIPKAQQYGFNITETTNAREQFSKAGGKRVETKDALGALAAEKAFTLDRSVIANQFSIDRLSKQELSPLQNISQTIAAMPELQIDSTRLEEVLNLQAELIKENSNAIEKANRGDITDIVSRFSSIDSEFFRDPQRLAPIITTINQSLKSPQNDFQKAESFYNLSQLKPDASYFEIQEMQEKGLSQEGILDQFLKTKEQQVGGGENLMIALKASIPGLSAAVSREIVEAFDGIRDKDGKIIKEGDRDIFKGRGFKEEELLDIKGSHKGDQDINRFATLNIEDQVIDRAKNLVTVKEKEKVRVDDAFVFGTSEGWKEAGHQLAENFVTELKRADLDFLGINISEKLSGVMSKMFHVKDPYVSQKSEKISNLYENDKKTIETMQKTGQSLSHLDVQFVETDKRLKIFADSVNTYTKKINKDVNSLQIKKQ